MVNPLIGIISYLPDNDTRAIRKEKLIALLRDCNYYFNLPIIIVAQNWTEQDEKDMYRYGPLPLRICHCQKLGITGARRKLRQWFLDTFDDFDCMIMLDDDCVLVGDKSGADYYLQQIQDHPGMSGFFNERVLKLFAASRTLLEKLDWPQLEAEDGEIFEDIYYALAANKLYPDELYRFEKTGGFKQNSDNVNDINSTWWHHQYDKHNIGDKTRALVAEL